jgi:hypothetical protein
MPEQLPFAAAVRKPPLTPRQAGLISLGGLGVGIVAVVVACAFFLVPLWQAMACYAVGAFFALAFPWASLEWKTRNRSVRAHNLFVYFFIATLIVTVIMQWGTEKKPFPLLAVTAIVVAGVAAYSVMAYYAIVNFRRWRNGDFKSLDQEKT